MADDYHAGYDAGYYRGDNPTSSPSLYNQGVRNGSDDAYDEDMARAKQEAKDDMARSSIEDQTSMIRSIYGLDKNETH
jgi:hypothetical protein